MELPKWVVLKIRKRSVVPVIQLSPTLSVIRVNGKACYQTKTILGGMLSAPPYFRFFFPVCAWRQNVLVKNCSQKFFSVGLATKTGGLANRVIRPNVEVKLRYTPVGRWLVARSWFKTGWTEDSALIFWWEQLPGTGALQSLYSMAACRYLAEGPKTWGSLKNLISIWGSSIVTGCFITLCRFIFRFWA